MAELTLDVRLDGFSQPVGSLVRDRQNALAFAYSKRYIREASALPLSLSLPLTDQPYADAPARAFFENLLQERDGQLTDIMARHDLQRDDIAGLLMFVGKDCAGALSVLPTGAPPTKVPGNYETDYVQLENQRLFEIVSALHNDRRLPAGTSDPSPLAGVQSKIALTRLPSGQLAEPKADTGAPTTHILKVPYRDRPEDAGLEVAALELSRRLDFDTADAELLTVGGINAILIKRFDRAHDEKGRVIRVHQEDFAQALGLPPSLKYERRGTPERRFNATAVRSILDQTISPAAERARFVRETLFDIAIGNVDAHAKNRAILYEGPQSIRVSPRYDLLPTRLDPKLTDEFPFNIGRATKLDELSISDFDAFLDDLGILTAAAKRRIRIQNATFISRSLESNYVFLASNNMRIFADLIAQNLRTLLPKLGATVPTATMSRDLFGTRGGGWLLPS